MNFFGIDACTGTGLAHVARITGAAVLPGFMLWEPRGSGPDALRFGPEVEIPHTADRGADILEGTRRCTVWSWSAGFGAILTSGCGFTGDGRRGRGRAGTVLNAGPEGAGSKGLGTKD